MSNFLLILILILNFQSWSKADDIRDFEIEGMSIGDSALEILTKEVLELQKIKPDAYYPNSKKFFTASFTNKLVDLKVYDALQFELKSKDRSYIIYSIMGKLYFKNNIEECYKKQIKIAKEITKIFRNATRDDKGISNHGWDKSGKSTRKRILFWFEGTDDYIKLVCFDWSEHLTQVDSLGVTINSGEFAKFLRDEVYK